MPKDPEGDYEEPVSPGDSTIKIHFRCVGRLQELTDVLEYLCGRDSYTVEMRHNMYVVRSKRQLTENEVTKKLPSVVQRRLMEELKIDGLGPKDQPTLPLK